MVVYAGGDRVHFVAPNLRHLRRDRALDDLYAHAQYCQCGRDSPRSRELAGRSCQANRLPCSLCHRLRHKSAAIRKVSYQTMVAIMSELSQRRGCLTRHAVSLASVVGGVAPNPSIERTSSSRLRLLPAAAHVERWAPVGDAGCTRCALAEAGSSAPHRHFKARRAVRPSAASGRSVRARASGVGLS